MRLTTEVVDEKQKAIVISKKNFGFISILKKMLEDSSVEYFFSSRPPSSFDIFNYCFFINEPVSDSRAKEHPEKKFVYIHLGARDRSSHHQTKHQNVKVIGVSGNHLEAVDLEKVLWFAFSKTKEQYLFLESRASNRIHVKHEAREIDWKKYLTRKSLIVTLIIGFFLYHLAFIPPLVISSIYTYTSYSALKKQAIEKANHANRTASFYLGVSKGLYKLARPTLLLFGVAAFPDNAVDLNSSGQTIITESISVYQNGKVIQTLILKKNKDQAETSDMSLRLKNLAQSMTTIRENLMVVNQKIPTSFDFLKKTKNNIIELTDMINKAGRMLDYFDEMVSSPTSKKYLIFFANNRELRPGGGFIGSYGILNMGNYTIEGIEVYDVYDADGQLKVHIVPPEPLSKYLGVPHWFLRDSNFSPDFMENYERALFFLEREGQPTDFEGTILITTTAIENLLTVFGDIYVPDYKEYINYKNFYLKTQLHVERDFFPGSTQKRNFLSSLLNQIFINLDRISLDKIGSAVKKSLDEKQIVVQLKDTGVQTFLDSSFWSGRVIEPKCNIPQGDCIIDYLFPFDANVGANKANYYVTRSLYLKTNIDKDGKINHLLSIQYKNSSPSVVFPTGIYRDYFQVLIPRDSQVHQVTKNGVKVEEIDQKDDIYKSVGFFFEVKPQETVEIKVNYTLGEVISGRQIYQFVVQKQIGAPNSDLVLEFNNASNVYVLNQNFSPVVNDREIVYNTNLSTDKIFLIELIKQ